MKAAVLEKFGSPLVIREVEEPSIGPEDVLVRVRACGICGTDLKIASGKIPGVTVPLIPGHEIAGEIARVGDQAGHLRVGDRVAVYFYVVCGRCPFCLSGQDSLCENLRGQIGFHLNGGLAEFVRVPATNVLHLSNSVSFSAGAVLADAAATPYQALVRHARLGKGEMLVVFGAGGLGLHAVQIGKILGASVVAVDTVESHRNKARELGAELAVDADEPLADIVKSRSEGRGADAVIDLVGKPETLERGLSLLGPGGRLLVVGYDAAKSFSVLPVQMVAKGLKIIGCRASTRADLADVIRWLEEKRMTSVVEESIALEEVNEAYERIRAGKVLGRIVAIP